MQDPIKSIHFSNSNPLCHAFDPDAKDGHDLLIGLTSGDGKHIFVQVSVGTFKVQTWSNYFLWRMSGSLFSVPKAAITRYGEEACWSTSL